MPSGPSGRWLLQPRAEAHHSLSSVAARNSDAIRIASSRLLVHESKIARYILNSLACCRADMHGTFRREDNSFLSTNRHFSFSQNIAMITFLSRQRKLRNSTPANASLLQMIHIQLKESPLS